MRLLPRLSAAALLLALTLAHGDGADVPDDWAYKPVARPTVPQTPKAGHQTRNPIDAVPAREAGREEAVVRARGRPPHAHPPRLLRPDRPAADAGGDRSVRRGQVAGRLREAGRTPARLAAASASGMAECWLDAVRYAETDGFKADAFRPHAWRYRDYVIKSFNADKPFDRFVKEQLAGDELYPDDTDALIATGFLRHFPDEYNAVNLEQRRQEILNDITDTTGAAFLGLTLGCCRCHDHKTDPIPQDDYYRVQAFFAGIWPVEVPLLPRREEGRVREAAGRVGGEDRRGARRDREARSSRTT